MNFRRLLQKSLVHYAGANLAVLAGAWIGAAALTGALLVGDSMRGTLRAAVLERLGGVEHALAGPKFFRQDLAGRLRESLGGRVPAASAVLLRAAVTGPEKRRASNVQVVGVNDEFLRLFPDAESDLARRVFVNERLAAALGLPPVLSESEPARVVLHLQEESDVPRDAPLGRRDVVPKPVPLQVARVVPDRGVGRFSLELSQSAPATLFVPIETLAEELRQPGRANALFLGRDESADADAIRQALERTATLEDLGLRIVQRPGRIVVESRENILPKAAVDAARQVAEQRGLRAQSILAYLANTIAVGDREIPYSIAAAVDLVDEPPLGPLGGLPEGGTLQPGEILLNQWAVDRLGAKVGDRVRLDYYVVLPDGSLGDGTHAFRLAGAAPMSGPAIERDYVPEFPGVTDADTIGEWDAPFQIRLERIARDDEKYWDDYRTAPKAFLRLEDGRAIWSTRFGDATSVRIAIPEGEDPQAFAESFGADLLSRLKPADLGLSFHPVLAEDLRASEGSTDFGMLFLSMSFFLIVSAALLVGLLFRLNTEFRASSVGLLSAVGWRPGRVRGLLVAEGAVLASLGSLLGLFGAVLYARWLLHLLSSRWRDAVGSTFLDFHWTYGSLAAGSASSFLVALGAIVWATRRIARIPAPKLLAGGYALSPPGGRGGLVGARVLAGAGLIGGLGLVGAGLAGAISQLAAFFAAGAALLVGSLALLAVRLNRPSARDPAALVRGSGALSIARLGMRNAGRFPARSLATAALLAFAVFLVASVGGMSRAAPDATPDKSSGNGGFAILAQAATPLPRDLHTSDGRFAMNVSDRMDKALARCEIFGFRVRPGDDASCLNVYQPSDPVVLGAPDAFLDRGGFAFASSLARTPRERENPWTLLRRPMEEEDVVPAIGDAATLQWILKVPLGGDVTIRDEAGRPVRLRIAAALSESIFQGQLLIGEADFLRLFPSIAGKGMFVIDAAGEDPATLADGLAEDLADFGLEVRTTREVLAAYLAVQATYMSAFETLGGLGLLLGTFGLAAVLLRNVFERRGEIALLSALGFGRPAIAGLVLSETAFLLTWGVAAGAVCALVAVSPQFRSFSNWSAAGGLAGTLLGVFALGLGSGLLATLAALRTPILRALRMERI